MKKKLAIILIYQKSNIRFDIIIKKRMINKMMKDLKE